MNGKTIEIPVGTILYRDCHGKLEPFTVINGHDDDRIEIGENRTMTLSANNRLVQAYECGHRQVSSLYLLATEVDPHKPSENSSLEDFTEESVL
jgi:hypothetical protein